MKPSAQEGYALAVAAEALYLANLLILPGLAFVILLVLWRMYVATAAPLARAHLSQCVSASLWAGALLLVTTTLMVAVGGFDSLAAWVVAIVYFTTCHAVLVLFGAFGLSKAMAGQAWRFPLVGRPLPDELVGQH